jgi:hypothetical protein
VILYDFAKGQWVKPAFAAIRVAPAFPPAVNKCLLRCARDRGAARAVIDVVLKDTVITDSTGASITNESAALVTALRHVIKNETSRGQGVNSTLYVPDRLNGRLRRILPPVDRKGLLRQIGDGNFGARVSKSTRE